MKKFALTAIASAALLVPAAPAVAGNADHPDQAKGPKAEKVSKAKAYGKYCQGQSKKHVKGEKGTAFSRCVTAMARADRNDSLSAREACKTLSKKHVKGVKGTPFSRCVVGVAQMRKDEDTTQA
ncbi:MAG: hypothetical protein KDB57_08855 [Solirubrobacterales bacterium]|nr:hypothetical protein [Solirubrobacterales bacterium]